MKKLTSLTICCTLMLAGAALAQQPEEQASPEAKPAQAEHGKDHAKPDKKANVRAPQGEPQQKAVKPAGDTINRAAEQMPAAPKEAKTAVAPKTAEAPKAKERGARVNTATEETPSATEPADKAEATAPAAPAESKKEMKNAKEKGKADATPAPTATITPMATATPAATVTPIGTPVPAPDASAPPAASTSATADTSAQVNATAKKPEPQQVEKIKEQHANFRAQPRPKEVPAVTFSADFRLQGSDGWKGSQYQVYRSYRPARHDRGYYHSKYKRVELVGGGYYYFDNGYWYPAWGYDNSAEYYAYDAPIYVGKRAVPPDRIIADVQAALQTMGYYRGEVDGLLGPLTREALTGYQSRQGLQVTAVIDEPTLDALGMG